ncbi:unnamed protein product [Allacma fusca]|uniref:Fatty acid synthase n=1 Tax=Allacma fusca TaxID=39272 RepID=A0A8J2K041_9HEXA|nr:unnamed protein product [Allacma fusca]
MDSTQQVNVGRANSCRKSVFVNIMNKCVDNDSEIVISGISGRYPKSDDISEFWKNLVEGNDMVSNSHDRYDELGLLVPSRMGVINSLDKFDADFFSVHTKLSNVMDPRLRKLLELSHEAILDAGVIPESIRGSNTAVFVAFEDSASCGITRRSKERTNLYSVVGNESAMLSNRLSYNFGLTGSSAHCNHDPVGSFMYHGLEMTSVDGKCKAFDAGADGFVQAEAAVAIYICKMAVAKRAYVTLVHAAINCDGYKEEGITFPSKVQQENVMRKVYEETGVNPHEVEYVEAHGTGTKVGDPQELNAIASVFCNGKKGPLLVGSVKSNMGHSEPAAGLCGISKLILSHMKGILPANLHYSSPNPEIPALIDGRVKVVDRNLEFKAKYASLNSIGYGGTNAHILLKFQNEEDVRNQWQPSIPLIILCSGRTEFAVQHFLDEAVIECQDQHFVKLLHELSREILPRQVYRGYVIVKFDEIESSVDKTEFKDSVWFIFSGVGSQWVGMAKDMITFDVFKKSIMKSNEYLANAGFSLMDLLESTDPTTFDGIKNSMVGVNSYQVALVDLLKSIVSLGTRLITQRK